MKHADFRRVDGYTAEDYRAIAAAWKVRIGLQSVALQQPIEASLDGSSPFGHAVGLGLEYINEANFSEDLEGAPYFRHRHWTQPAYELGVRLQDVHTAETSPPPLYVPFMRGVDTDSLALMPQVDAVHAAFIGNLVASNMRWSNLRNVYLGPDTTTLYLPLPVAHEP